MGKKRRYRKYPHKFGKKYGLKYGLNKDAKEHDETVAKTILRTESTVLASGARH